MKSFDCLTSKHGKYVLLKDYGDTSYYAVLCISKVDTIIKTDKRIKSTVDFIGLYGFEAKPSVEIMSKALIWKQK